MTARSGFLILDATDQPVEGAGCALLFDTYEQALDYCERSGDATLRPAPARDDSDEAAGRAS